MLQIKDKYETLYILHCNKKIMIKILEILQLQLVYYQIHFSVQICNIFM